jgi:hypothetical protein
VTDRLQQQVELVLAELKNPPEIPDDPTEVKKVVKKVKKSDKKAKSAPKKSAAPANGGVSLADLAKEKGVSPAYARKVLRDADVERSGRWTWEKDSKGLKDARKALGLA